MPYSEREVKGDVVDGLPGEARAPQQDGPGQRGLRLRKPCYPLIPHTCQGKSSAEQVHMTYPVLQPPYYVYGPLPTCHLRLDHHEDDSIALRVQDPSWPGRITAIPSDSTRCVGANTAPRSRFKRSCAESSLTPIPVGCVNTSHRFH